MRNQRTQIIVELALCVALAAALNFASMRLPINVAGGSVSLVMLPIAVVALRRGALPGAAAGLMFGFLDLLMEPYILVPAQVALDYPLPYLSFGLGVGLFSALYMGRKPGQSQPDTSQSTTDFTPSGVAKSPVLIVAMLVGAFLRLVCHVLSGVIFFAEYAGDQNVWIYSFVYNISYIAPSVIAATICLLILMPILNRVVPTR